MRFSRRSVFVALTSLFSTAVAVYAQTNTYDFGHARWGMTEEQVKKSEPGAILKEWVDRDVQGNPMQIVSYSLTVAGVGSYVMFGFHDKKLNVVDVCPRQLPASKGQLEARFAAFASSLTVKYGNGLFHIGSESNGWRHVEGDLSAAFDEFYRRPKDDMRQTFTNGKTLVYLTAEHNDDGTYGISLELDQFQPSDF